MSISPPVLITGVGQRVGLALAENLLSAGYPVIGTYRTWRLGLDGLKQKGVALFKVDFYQEGDLQILIRGIEQEYDSLRAIIHNASDWLADAPQSSNEHQQVLRQMMQVHMEVPYIMNMSLSPLLECSDQPADIIHITDYVASTGSAKHAAYAASKAALENLTQSFAVKYAPKIKVNAIAPALILFNDHDDAAYREKAVKKALIQKEGGLQEMINAVRYLMDSEYVTGRVLPVDGGRHLAVRK